MGKSDPFLLPFYQKNISPKGSVALLGFTDNRLFHGDLYDLQIGNWNINSDWSLPQRYDTIISLRCPYFSKNPIDFVDRCYDNLKEGGVAYLDWGLGDHWRFEQYKVGWVKNDEHEFAYKNDNFLWSCCWDEYFESDDFLQSKVGKEVINFKKRIEKFNYHGKLFDHIKKEVPFVFSPFTIEKFKSVKIDFLSLWDDFPQIYILLKLEK